MSTQDWQSSSVSAVPAEGWEWATTSSPLGAGLSLRPAPNLWCHCQSHWLCSGLSQHLLRGRKQDQHDLCSPRAAVSHSSSLVTLGQSPALCEPQTYLTQGNHSSTAGVLKPQAAKVHPPKPLCFWGRISTCSAHQGLLTPGRTKVWSCSLNKRGAGWGHEPNHVFINMRDIQNLLYCLILASLSPQFPLSYISRNFKRYRSSLVFQSLNYFKMFVFLLHFYILQLFTMIVRCKNAIKSILQSSAYVLYLFWAFVTQVFWPKDLFLLCYIKSVWNSVFS